MVVLAPEADLVTWFDAQGITEILGYHDLAFWSHSMSHTDEYNPSWVGQKLLGTLHVELPRQPPEVIDSMGSGSTRDRAETNACRTDTKTLKTAIVAWNTEYLSGGSAAYSTPYPPSESALTNLGTPLLQEESSLHDLTGGGATVPVIVKAAGKCEDEEITQLS